ncbi:hypothetical protein SEA_KIKO_64 [Gordonia phage Kiko]|nr:hypothetical protein SEA_KIKO_64 [Gordonia phage Kiko]
MRPSRSKMRARIGWWLRCLADRIDHAHSPRITGWTFTFERGRGAVFHHDPLGPMTGRGCRIVYFADEYDRAHDDAENPL